MEFALVSFVIYGALKEIEKCTDINGYLSEFRNKHWAISYCKNSYTFFQFQKEETEIISRINLALDRFSVTDFCFNQPVHSLFKPNLPEAEQEVATLDLD
mgnify:CR=1 FL=1